MSFIKKLFYVLWVVLIPALCSCEDDDESVDIYYNLCCSKDLLDFVVPVVSYTDENGTEQSMTLSDEYWKQEQDVDDGDSNTESQKYKYWSKHIHFDCFDVSSKAVVRYMPKSTAEDFGKSIYLFVHRLNCSYQVTSKSIQNQNIVLDFSRDILIGEKDVQEYIDSLVNTPDEVRFSVDKNGKVDAFSNYK
ncbi:MAG: hypothetical protein LUD00_11020 [Prevotellaceae bacterium]|nr:hypothetical protein [Prevotellaceae bacterium]